MNIFEIEELPDVKENEIIDILKMAAHESGKCVVVVTHSPQVADACDEVLTLEEGQLKKSKGKKG